MKGEQVLQECLNQDVISVANDDRTSKE